jgi:hypothetical protein
MWCYRDRWFLTGLANEEPGRRSVAKLLTKDEARRIAAYVAKLPMLVPQHNS